VKLKFAIVTLAVGIPAFFLGPVFWPPELHPVGLQMLGFAVLSGIESLLFGFGIAFLAFGYPLLCRTSGRKHLLPVFLSVSWLLVSWWPHDSIHAHNGMNLNGLLAIDYGFHLTLILAALILAHHVYGIIRHGAGSKDDDVKKGGYEVWT